MRFPAENLAREQRGSDFWAPMKGATPQISGKLHLEMHFASVVPVDAKLPMPLLATPVSPSSPSSTSSTPSSPSTLASVEVFDKSTPPRVASAALRSAGVLIPLRPSSRSSRPASSLSSKQSPVIAELLAAYDADDVRQSYGSSTSRRSSIKVQTILRKQLS
mmetsp:Transcript_44966/g.73266  ORF Transcript_44966/g.73266 Transcript_44966/m.73266 type:complete len:162 (+) Transcript_44966:375-860(+)